MTTTYELLQRARRLVMGNRRDLMTTVASTELTPTATSLTVASGTGFAAQHVIEIDSEQMYVSAVSTNTLTIVRGFNGTEPTEHAVGAYVIGNPTVTLLDLLDAANAELASLSSPENGLYRVWHADITASTGNIGFNLAPLAGFLDVIKVAYRATPSLNQWKPIHGWQVQRDALLDDFPSGVGISFPGGLPGTYTTRVWYKAAFGSLSGLPAEDVVAVTGLPATAIDILAMGAALRTVEAREIHRTQTSAQGDTRRVQDVPMGNALQSTSVLRRTRNERIAEEAARLLQAWGR